ncbi:MAG: ABC transporter ATP-binding protein [Bdellovibrionales bacterium]|nr:ABC transporter ATP-binding protein [Bdellovibrionales bacterium]
MNLEALISLKDITLTYEMHYDRSQSLKETVINRLMRRRYVDQPRSEFNALEHLDLEIKQGERVGIIGRNGAGKSTLLKVISGILKPSEGRVEVVGTIQPLIEVAAGFNPEFSGRENIYLNGYMLGFTTKQIKDKEEDIIDFSELTEFIDVPVKYYSTGMAVRLAFTIATNIDPEILLFDEMLSAGDAAFVKKAKKRMDDLVERAKIVVVVSHDLQLIKTFCSRCIVLESGKAIFDGDPTTAVDEYLDRQA